ncbi:MAG: hypothetical protein Q8O40_06560 [Chloroflexota bacterium]|nr:hypothetical protein [Chloroflexota bacterium]
MKILMRAKPSDKWQPVEQTKGLEAGLQKLLERDPSIIPMDDIRGDTEGLVFAVPEFPLPNNQSIDLLAFSGTGEIAIIECKRASNPEVKREVIGQTLEYAASLWHMSYEDLDARISGKNKQSLAETIKELAPDFEEVAFRARVKEVLETGAFVLVIVVDQMNDDLRNTIQYLNACSASAFSIHALEMQVFLGDGVEVAVPELYGQAVRPRAHRERWDFEKFKNAISQHSDGKLTEAACRLYDWSTKAADRVYWGTGRQYGSFTFHYVKGGRTISVFSVYTEGKLYLNYGWLVNQIPPDLLKEFHTRLTAISAFRNVPEDFKKWPGVGFKTLFNNEDFELFKSTVQWLGDRLKS